MTTSLQTTGVPETNFGNLAPQSHHSFGPSKWPMWAECARYDGEDIDAIDIESVQIVEGQLPAKTKPDESPKARGQVMHNALAKAIKGIAQAFEGLDADEEQQVRWVAEAVIEFAAAHGYTPAEIEVETRVTMYVGDSFEEMYFGTMDIRFGPFIMDAKFGDERNYVPQMAGYALPLMERYGYKWMFAVLLYGRWRAKRMFTLDRATVETLVYGILNKRKNPHSQPKACSYCGWCKHKLTCSVFVSEGVNTLLGKRPDWGMILPSMSVSDSGPNPVMVGAFRWLAKTYIEPWIDAVDFQSKAMAESGNVPLGFTKRDERGRLEFPDSAKVIEAMQAAGVELGHIYGAADFGHTALAKAYVAQFGCSEATAKTKVENLLVKAGAARRGDSTFKLLKQADAEDSIRAALARPATPVAISQ